MNTPAYICDAVRTPFGRCGGVLRSMRADDLAAIPLIALAVRNPQVDWEQLDDVWYGCAHPYSGTEHIGNIAHVATARAGLPSTVPAVTINRLCGSGLDAVGSAARAIKSGEMTLVIAGGVESMSRAMHTHDDLSSSSRNGQAAHVACAALAAESIAAAFAIDRQSQDRYAWASAVRMQAARQRGYFDAEITPVTVADKGHDPVIVTDDERSIFYTPEELAALPPLTSGATPTHGNSADDADGACALLLACEKTAHKYSLLPRAKVLGMAVAGVPQSATGIGPATAVRKLLVQTRLSMEQIDVIELNDLYAAQSLAVLRDWALQDDDPRVNPNGGAMAIGNPHGASGARLVLAALGQLHRMKARYALCATCIGAGQGIAMVIERV